MSQALYRKNRPKKLDDVLGQEHIITTLKNAIKTGKISHAYLFTGPRGVGKTSVARILAHEVNKLPYDDESMHLDIIEIDAASNRRIDEIRDLRDKVHISPTSSTYKVYIIDEVHMLTKEAFNALLKTLEEPPAHVIFILATTEAHKLPETIISRPQRFSFKPIDNASAIKRLKDIAKTENIVIDDEAIGLIAEHGEGSFRDSLSLLDQASGVGKKVGIDDIRRLLGIAPAEAIDQLIASLSSDPRELLSLLTNLREQGYQSAHLAKQLGQTLREQLINGSASLRTAQITKLLQQLLEVAGSPQPDRLLEVVLLDVVLNSGSEPQTPQVKPEKVAAKVSESVKTVKQSAPIKPANTEARVTSGSSALKLSQWPDILGDIKKSHSTLYSMLRMAKPALVDQKLTLTFKFAFHQKQVSESKNLKLISDVVKRYSQVPLSIVCITAVRATSPPEESNSPVETINSIFGGSEVLES